MPFEDFYTTYRPYVERVIRAVVRGASPELVEDLMQTTFLHAWKAYGGVKDITLRAWIARIARNVAIDSLRALKVRRRFTFSWNEEEAGQIPDLTSVATMAPSEEVTYVQQVLAGMKQQDRELLALLSQQYKTAEIAEILGLTVACCRQRMYRAKGRFRARYEEGL